MAATRKLGYQWHLRVRMAEAGMYATTDLTPLLAELSGVWCSPRRKPIGWSPAPRSD